MPISKGVPYELSTNEIAGLVPEGGRGKLFESREIAEWVRMKPALMRAKPRCGHHMSISQKQEGQAADCFRGGHLASQQSHHAQYISLADCFVSFQSEEVLRLPPATIVRGAALPAFGHAEPGWDASAPIRSNNLRAVQVGIVAALLTAGNAK